jgi:hypothetical protein
MVLAAVAAAGLAGVGLAWSGAAATLLPQVQLPYLVSGAVGGIALAGAALAVLATHLERRSSAADRTQVDAVIRAAVAIAEDLPAALASKTADRREQRGEA